jgi:hypothetical protein
MYTVTGKCYLIRYQLLKLLITKLGGAASWLYCQRNKEIATAKTGNRQYCTREMPVWHCTTCYKGGERGVHSTYTYSVGSQLHIEANI